MAKVVIIGGGWAGVSSAVAATQAGAQVILLERTDMLLGTGLVGGIMRNNGRFTAAEEAVNMGMKGIFDVLDSCARHKNIDFPGHKHADLYDVTKIEPAVRTMLLEKGVTIRTQNRVKDVYSDGGRIQAVALDHGEAIAGDVFVETTGTAGGPANCRKYGNGCVMCSIRCPTFGARVSIAAKAGVEESAVEQNLDGKLGAMSGSCKLFKESLAEDIVENLNKDGLAIIPLPEELRKGEELLATKACQQYALEAYAENIVLLDTGQAKLMLPMYPLDELRKIAGLENARFADPYVGGRGNSIRFLGISPRDNFLKVEGVDNLFCAGEKAGPMVGHTEAICTGSLAGHNAVRYTVGQELLSIPEELAVGDFIVHVNEQIKNNKGLAEKFTFSGSVYFERMQKRGLYTTETEVIKLRVEEAGMADVYARPLVL